MPPSKASFPARSSGSKDASKMPSPGTPKSTKVTTASGSESDSAATNASIRSSTNRSPKVIKSRSPKSPVTEKKIPSRVPELESQLAQLQEDLKKTKDELNLSKTCKTKAQDEAEDAKKQLLATTAKLEESQHQVVEFCKAEEARLQELIQMSQDREQAWKSELEALQTQHSMDSAALCSAMTEMQRLKDLLGMAVKASGAEQAALANSKLQALQQEMFEMQSAVENLKAQLGHREKAEAEAQAMASESRQQLETANMDVLHADGLKLSETLDLTVSELEESRARVCSLEQMVRSLQEDLLSAGNLSAIEKEGILRAKNSSLQSEIELLKCALEAVLIEHQELQVQTTMQLCCAQELVELMKIESEQKEAKLESAVRSANAEIFDLKANLDDKEEALQNLLAVNKELQAEKKERLQERETRAELEGNLRRYVEAISELKEKLMDKETELQNISEENGLLKLETANREAEMCKRFETATAEMELVKASEREALLKLGYVTEEADKNGRRAARLVEQLNAVQAANSEMESELKRLRVQSDQWRKAAEAAAAVLSTGNNIRSMERTGSMDASYNSLAGKLLNSPFSDDLSEDSPKKKNGSVLKRIGGLLRKGTK